MVLMAGMDLPERAIREQMSSAINIVIQLSRMSDGTRKVVRLSEISGMEGNIIVMQDIFVYNKKGVAEDGRVIGDFIATGVRPKFADKLMVSGIQLPTDIFDK
jgi:pilus assembly protein CpaF